jgi:FKBP-type peptidyl-prolyl cis-trans isomerase SlyD
MKIDKTSFVTIDYLIRLGENEFFPSSGQPEEISFCLGWGTMPPGLEAAMLGMVVNNSKEVSLSPQEAYGEVDEELIMEVPRGDFDPDLDIALGQVFETQDEEGHPLYFMIKELRPDTVVIDFNHPLAGKTLEVSFTVKEVREATPQDLQPEGTCSCCGGEPHSH